MNSGHDDLWTLAEPVAAELGLEVLDIEFLGKPPRQVVRIYLDGPTAQRRVSMADCEAMSRRMADILDAHEVIAGRYMLEVSSPGVNRRLKRPEHFRRVVGGRIRVRLTEPLDGIRNLIGRLDGMDDDVLNIVADDGREISIGIANVERANFEFEFPTAGPKAGKGRR